MAQLIEKLDQKGKVTGPQQSVSQTVIFLQSTSSKMPPEVRISCWKIRETSTTPNLQLSKPHVSMSSK